MIYHVYSHYTPKNPDTLRRMALAKKTWAEQLWTEIPVSESNGRTFQDRGGRVPFIKDIIAVATAAKAAQDIIVLTNADICVAKACSLKIVAALQSIDAGYCFRRDFPKLSNPIPDESIKTGSHYVGSDLYAFRVGWWNKYGSEFPDMLLGRECWDAILRLLIDDTHPGRNPTLYDLIYHERHASTWENPSNKRTLTSQLHNIGLARKWMIAYGHNPRTIGI